MRAVADRHGLALVEDAAFSLRLNALTTEEQDLLVSAALRREELSMEARLSLFAGLAAPRSRAAP